MSDLIETVMNISFTVFAIYGTYTVHKWHVIGTKADKLLDNLREDIDNE